MDDTASTRLARLCSDMDRYLRSIPPAERDRRMQEHLAQAKTPSERLRTLCVMMDWIIARNVADREADS